MVKDPIIEAKRKVFCIRLGKYARSKMTQTELALQTGLAQSNLSRIFSGKYPPTLDILLSIMQALDITWADLDSPEFRVDLSRLEE